MINVTVQHAVTEELSLPGNELFSKWVNAANINISKQVELTIRIVDEVESAELNEKYRNKKSATNVLAFPFEVDEGIDLNLLGDIVICAQIIIAEAKQQLKSEFEHWAHMVVHGVLHLQSYNHLNEKQAEEMESLEIKILDTLGYQNPYLSNKI